MARISRSATLLDCIGLFFVACAIRLFWFDHFSLWSDELFSVYWSQQDPGFLLGQGARIETNPPGYYMLLHMALPAIGTTAMAIRALSVALSAATVLVTYALGRTLLDRAAALLAAAFMAIDPMALVFAQEARPYALLGLLNGLALLSLARLARRPAATPWPWVALFVLCAVGSVLAHYTAVFFVAACFAGIGLHLVTTRPFPVRQAALWAGAAVVILLAIAEPMMLARSLSHSSNIHWIGKLSPRTVVGFFLELLTHSGTPRNLPSFAAGAVLLLVLGAGLVRFRADRVQAGILLLIPAVFCVLLIGASLARPMLLSRVGVWLVIPLCLLLARGTLSQPTARVRVAAAIVTSVVLLFGVAQYFSTNENEDWRAAADLLAGQPGCAGPVLVSGDNALGLAYYGPAQAARATRMLPVPSGDATTAEFLLTDRVMHPGVMAPDLAAGFIQANPNAVVVLRSIFLPELPAPLRDLLLHAPFQAALGGGLVVSCFPKGA